MLEELIPINLSSQGGGGGKGGRWGKGKLLLLAAPSLGIIRIFICFSGGQFHPPGFISTIRQWSWIFPWNFDWKLGAIDGIDGIDGIGGPSGWGLPTASHRRGIESMRRVRNNCWLMMQYLGHAAIIPLIYLLVGLGWLGLAWVGLGFGWAVFARQRESGRRPIRSRDCSQSLFDIERCCTCDWCFWGLIECFWLVLKEADRFRPDRLEWSLQTFAIPPFRPGASVCVCVCVCLSVCH